MSDKSTIDKSRRRTSTKLDESFVFENMYNPPSLRSEKEYQVLNSASIYHLGGKISKTGKKANCFPLIKTIPERAGFIRGVIQILFSIFFHIKPPHKSPPDASHPRRDNEIVIRPAPVHPD
jgi:hypothetical protein